MTNELNFEKEKGADAFSTDIAVFVQSKKRHYKLFAYETYQVKRHLSLFLKEVNFNYSQRFVTIDQLLDFVFTHIKNSKSKYKTDQFGYLNFEGTTLAKVFRGLVVHHSQLRSKIVEENIGRIIHVNYHFSLWRQAERHQINFQSNLHIDPSSHVIL